MDNSHNVVIKETRHKIYTVQFLLYKVKNRSTNLHVRSQVNGYSGE